MVRNGEPARSAGSGVESGGAGAKSAPRFGITWSDQSVRLLALALAVIAVLWLARGIIGPFVVAGVIAYAFSPVVSAVHSRTRLPRVVIIAIGYVLFLGALAVVAYFAAERAGRELNELTSNGHDIFSTGLHKLLGNTIVIAGNAYNVEELSKQLKDALLGMVSSPTSAVQLAERAVDLALQAILCLIITFYLLLDGHRFGEFALRFLGREQRADTLRLTHRIHTVLGRWLRGQMFLIALVAVVFYVILGPILHVPYALLLAILSGVLEIIPLVGPIIAAALAGTVTFATHGTDTTIVVLVVYLIVRQVEDQVVMPLVIGRAVHLHPVITIFAVLVGLSTWGILGGLLGVPVAAAINVTLHELYPEETREYSDKVVAVGRSTRRRPAMASGQPQAVGAAVTAGQIETGQTGQIGAARATELGPEPDVPDPDVPSGDPR
jgi:predicted PurR-regulated permease PerM